MTATVVADESTLDPPLDVAAPLLSVREVGVEFERFIALRSVSFDLHSGHLLGLIGPNGAGKTTLLRAISGLQTMTRGSVHLFGEPLPPHHDDLFSRIGFTPDTPPVYEDLTVEHFLTMIGKGYNLTAADTAERVDFWLEKTWLKEKAKTKIKSLSRGMRQRVGLARTMLPNPSIVLLDEPAAGLDPAGRVQFRQLLCDLREQGKALIVSSHILADMGEYCTHIGVMNKGRMLKFGTVDQVTHMHGDTRRRYTATLASPVTNLSATLGAIDGLSNAQVDRDRIVFEFDADRGAAAKLLADLVGRGIPIASFTPDVADLESAYLRIGIQQVD